MGIDKAGTVCYIPLITADGRVSRHRSFFSMRALFRRSLAPAAALGALFSCSPAHALFDLTLTQPGGLSWVAAVDPASTTAKVSYIIFERFGFKSPTFTLNGDGTINPASLSPNTTNHGTVVDKTSIKLTPWFHGTSCFLLIASDTVSGIFDASVVQCHSFMHDSPGGNNQNVLRADSIGGQLGFGQLWNFSYYLDGDAKVTMRVYPPNTRLAVDATGFWNVAVATATPTKIVVDHIPRSGEMADFSWKNTEMWDCRDTTGSIVSNGIYYGHFLVTDDLLTPTTRYVGIVTIPVDIIRFTAFSTEGISPTVSLGLIKYTITGAATVRIVIAKPGWRMAFDSNGDVWPYDLARSTIDTSTNSVVQVLTYNKSPGSYSEGWNGTDMSGVAVSSGLYSVGMSARDAFDNQALNLQSNHDGPVFGTLSVERAASQTGIDTTPPTVTGVTVGGQAISLSGGTSVNAGFTQVAFTLNKPGGTGSNASIITLTNPAGTAVGGGTVATSSNVVTLSTAVPQNSTGTYTVTIIAKDTLGNASSLNTYTFVSSTDTTLPTVASIQVNGTTISLTTPNTFLPGVTSVVVNLSKPSGTGVFKSTVTLTDPLGVLVSSLSFTISSNTLTFTPTAAQTSTGTYTITIYARDTNGNASAPLTYGFVIAIQSNPGGQTQENFENSLKIYPNPVRGAPLNVEFTLYANSTVEIDVFNILGERCRHQSLSLLAGLQTLTWNLANDSSNAVGNGVYILRIRANDGRQTLKVVKKVMVLK
jgi:hypothetical protein